MRSHDPSTDVATDDRHATRWWHRWFRRRATTAPRTLADLHPGQRAVVSSVACDSAVGQRMLHLGLLEGTEVMLVRRAPAGDPLEVRVAGYALSVRASEARLVGVEVHR
jgi:Fe2+ transport system protein FeoA